MGSAGNGRRIKRRAGTKAIDKCQNGGPSREIENSELIVIIPSIVRSIFLRSLPPANQPGKHA